MSEAKTKIEIDDVLSSIRRLVSQDAMGGAYGSAARSGSALRAAEPARAKVEEPIAEAEDAAECLVLTPALRVGEAEVAEEIVVEEEPALAEDLGDELSRLESTIAEMELAVAESGIAFEPELGDHFEAGEPATLADPEDEVEGFAFAPEAELSEVEAEAPPAPVVEAFVWTRALSSRAESRLGASHGSDLHDPMLSDAARELEEGVILEAETLHDLPETALVDLADVVAHLVDEEVAPLEALDAQDDVAGVEDDTFAPMLDVSEDLTGAEEAFEQSEPAIDLELAEAEELAAESPELLDIAAVEEPAIEAFAEEVPAAAGEEEAALDPDLHDAAWDDADALDWAAEEEVAELPEIEGEIELPELAEETLELEEAEELRRAHLSDAEVTRQAPEILRSSYDALRDEYATEESAEEDVPSGETFEGGSVEAAEAEVEFDHDALQAYVAELIRQEFRGVLGERITQNVRKLVRREIQRALMNRDYE